MEERKSLYTSLSAFSRTFSGVFCFVLFCFVFAQGLAHYVTGPASAATSELTLEGLQLPDRLPGTLPELQERYSDGPSHSDPPTSCSRSVKWAQKS